MENFLGAKKRRGEKGNFLDTRNSQDGEENFLGVEKGQSNKGIWRALGEVLILTVWTGAVIFAMMFILSLVMGLILGEALAEPMWTGIYSALAYILAFLVLWQLTPRIAKHRLANREELGLKGWPTWTDIGLAPVGFVVAILLAGLATGVMQEIFPWFDAEEQQNLSFAFYLTGIDRIIAFVVLVVVAPIAEELIFRGWLYGKLRSVLGEKLGKWGSIALAIVATSLMFAILHGQINVGVTVFILSVVMCGLREITGTIYAGILVHMIKNGIAFYLLYVLGVG